MSGNQREDEIQKTEMVSAMAYIGCTSWRATAVQIARCTS